MNNVSMRIGETVEGRESCGLLFFSFKKAIVIIFYVYVLTGAVPAEA